jgi:hypothetical protein
VWLAEQLLLSSRDSAAAMAAKTARLFFAAVAAKNKRTTQKSCGSLSCHSFFYIVQIFMPTYCQATPAVTKAQYHPTDKRTHPGL